MKTEEYFDKLYNAIIEILRLEKLEWIIQEIEARNRVGKITILTPEEVKNLPRSKKQRTFSTDYTSKERLMLLIDAIEYVVTNNTEMEQEILQFFSSETATQLSKKAKAIHFYAEDGNDNVTIVDRQSVIQHQDHAHDLKEVIDKLKELINDDN
ncbi:MAG TPA: hypothetical protein VEP90_21315 [Methylomirabilota bacterium]|nr:hypothetical protein [Methylomirabilota bacterium]